MHNGITKSSRIISRSVLAATLIIASSSLILIAPEPVQAQFQARAYYTEGGRRANKLYSLGKWEDAEKAYTQALRANPGDASARAGLAIVQAELLKLGAAEKNALQAMKQNPRNAYPHIALGIVYKNQTLSSDMTYRGRTTELYNKAEKEFQAAIQRDPGNPEAHNNLGEIYRLQGRWDEAAEEFNRAAKQDPRYSEAVANQGTIAYHNGNNEEAMGKYRQAIRLNSKNNLAHYYLGVSLMVDSKYHEAIQSFNTALYQNRNSAPVHTKMAEAFSHQGNEAAAIAHYREAIRIKPEYTEAYRKLADMFDNRGDGEFAVAELKSALNANPNYIPFQMDIARLSLTVDKPDQAILYYKEVLKQEPSNPEALRGLSQAYYSRAQTSASQGALGGSDEFVEAEQAISNALQANPNDISLHLAMLRVAKLSGKPDLAKDQLEKIVASPANNEAERVAKAEALFALGRYGEADGMARNLLNELSNDTRKQLLLADTLKVDGNLDMAAEAYKFVQAKEPDNLKAERGLQRVRTSQEEARKKLTLAKSLDNYKQRKSAKDFYVETIGLYPRQPEARLSLGRIYATDKEYAKAIFEYQSYLNMMPNLPETEKRSIERKIKDLQASLARQQSGRSSW